MLRYLKLKNYRSITDLSFDMTGKNGEPKKMIVLYGENGVGKTNIVNVLDTLYDIFHTLSFRNFIMSLLENQADGIDSNNRAIFNSIMDVSHLILENKTIDSEGEMCIEFGFCIDNKNGVYRIEFDNERIIKERLEFVLNKNKIVFYDLAIDSHKVNSQIVSNAYLADLNNAIEKYWGKHSLMAILFNAFDEYTFDYISETLSESLIQVVHYFQNFTAFLVKNKTRKGNIGRTNNLLNDFDEGEIDDNQEVSLRYTQELVNLYFTELYTDITRVYYKTENANGKIKYCLFFRRIISGKEIDVKYDEESCGTRNLLSLLPYLLAAIDSRVVAIDEIDNGIHDILLCSLINNLYKNIDGQLLVTTHNTAFLEEYELKDSLYFLVVDEAGNKEIKSINDFGFRIQPNSNVMANYLKGRFSKSPWNGTNIDFASLKGLNVDNL